MAIFDNSYFEPQAYNGGMSSWLLQALQNGLLSRAGVPDVTPTGPTYARGNEGMMGGVPFPIAGSPDPGTAELSAQSVQPAQMPQQPSPQMTQPRPSFSNVFGVEAPQRGGGWISGLMDTVLPRGPMASMQRRKAELEMNALEQAPMQQRQMAQGIYDALLARGVQPQVAYAAAINGVRDPKLAEALWPQALGLKPPATVEGVIADQLYRGGQGSRTPGAAGTTDALEALRKLEEAKSSGAASGKTTGEKTATAQMELPSAIATAQEQLRLLDLLKNHPGRSQVGWHDPFGDAPLVRSTKGFDAQTLLDQIKGSTFLEAYKTLRGGGQITQIEGEKATAALNRMSRAQSREEFDRAINDYTGILRLGIDRAAQQAGLQAPFGFKGNQPQPISKEAYDALPRGKTYVAPDGTTRIKK